MVIDIQQYKKSKAATSKSSSTSTSRRSNTAEFVTAKERAVKKSIERANRRSW